MSYIHPTAEETYSIMMTWLNRCKEVMAHTNKELISKMSRLRGNFYEAVTSIIDDYPRLNKKKDVKITFFSKSSSGESNIE